jgi:hypothetical protein
MKSWNELIEIALVGTDKRGFSNAEVLPELQQKSDSGSESEQFLNALSLTHFYRMGAMKSLKTLAETGIEIEENRAVISLEQQLLLQDILFQDANWSFELLTEWVSKITKDGKRVHPSLVKRVIDKIAAGNLQLKKEELPVLGETGTYVAKRFGLLENRLFYTEEELFLNAPMSEIKQYLLRLKKVDASHFLKVIKAQWVNFSLVDQLFWVRQLRFQPNEETIIFAKHLLEAEFPAKPKETVNYSRVRSQLIAILVSDSKMTIHQETLASLKKYVSKQPKGFFGKLLKSGPDVQLELPEQEDAFLNETHFHEQLGLVLEAPVRSVKEERILAYFKHLFSILPFKVWTDLLECTTEVGFNYFFQHKTWWRKTSGEESWELNDPLMETATYSNEAPFLFAFGKREMERHNWDALAAMPYPIWSELVLQHKNELGFHDVFYLIDKAEIAELSPDLGQFVLKLSWKHYQQTNYYTLGVFHQIIGFFPVQLIAELEGMLEKARQTDHGLEWSKTVAIPLLEYLKLKQRIEKL